MSLQLAAQHLREYGRGDDNHLVHMTTGELESLQKLAQAGGGSLTVNPHTGLPEAGFLSSMLPMLAGAALDFAVPGLGTLATAGIVGAADAALTGSLSQGLMAGLGAWGGANLGENIASFGSSAASAAPSVAPTASNALASTTGGSSMLGDMSNIPLDTTGGGIVGSGQSLGTEASLAGQTPGNYLTANSDLSTTVPTATPYTKGAEGGYSWEQLKQGASNVASHPMDYLKQPGVGLNAAMTLAPPIMAGMQQLNQQAVPTQQKDTNPMHLKVNPQWTGPTQPAQPNPYTKATYPNYVQTPYTAAGGGLMDIGNYDDGGSTNLTQQQKYNAMNDINTGASMMSPQHMAMPAYNAALQIDPGTYAQTNAEYERTSPLDMMKLHQIKHAAGLRPTMSLGSYSIDPAMVSNAQIAQEAQKQQPGSTMSSKEGGLQHYADGGVTSYAKGNYVVPGAGNYLVPASSNSLSPQSIASVLGGFGHPSTQNYGMANFGNTSNIQTPDISGINYFGQGQTSNTPASTPTYSAQNLSPDFGHVPEQTATPIPNMRGHIYVPHYAEGGELHHAMGGLGDLGSYSDGGRLLKGPGDGVSDSIPASIGGKQPARLASGEFVIPSRIVSELGNGSTDAGAKRLYAMMERVQNARKKSIGKDKVAVDAKSYKYLPI